MDKIDGEDQKIKKNRSQSQILEILIFSFPLTIITCDQSEFAYSSWVFRRFGSIEANGSNSLIDNYRSIENQKSSVRSIISIVVLISGLQSNALDAKDLSIFVLDCEIAGENGESNFDGFLVGFPDAMCGGQDCTFGDQTPAAEEFPLTILVGKQGRVPGKSFFRFYLPAFDYQSSGWTRKKTN